MRVDEDGWRRLAFRALLAVAVWVLVVVLAFASGKLSW